ncbi:hypothetical protein ACWELJ_22640 [Nocardia sp. NPDC004582]
MVSISVAGWVRGWGESWRTRYRVAAWLAIPGALLWMMEAFGAWMQSQEAKWQSAPYLTLGATEVAADSLLALLVLAFLLVSALLMSGAVLLLRGNIFGRYPLLAGAWLVLLGQFVAAVLAWIPIDAFYYSTPPSFVFATPLIAFPIVAILCLTRPPIPLR